jgi:hypothetical protein
LFCLLCAVGGALPTTGQEDGPLLLAEESAGIMPLESVHRRLEIVDLLGEIIVRAGRPGELRFMAIDADRKRERLEVPIAVLEDGNTLILEPAAGRAETRVVLEVSVPQRFEARFDLRDCSLRVSDLQGGVEIVGENLEVKAGSVGGGMDVELRDSRLSAEGVNGDVDVQGVDLDAAFNGVGGFVYASTRGGSLELVRVAGEVEYELEDSRFVAEEITGKLLLTGTGGEASVAGLGGGAEIRVDGTRVRLEKAEGDIVLETDAEVEFKDCAAFFHIDSYGGSLTGSGNSGHLEVKTEDAVVSIQGVQGQVRIQGQRLGVRLADITEDVMVLAGSSEIEIEGATGAVTVENEFGGVRVADATKLVEITSQDGSVEATGLTGPVRIAAEGEQVLVAWNSLNIDENCRIKNEGGDVTLHIPNQGGGRVEAKTRYGDIESDFPEIVVADDGRSADGILNRRNRPLVQVEAHGTVRLRSADSVEEEP